MNVIRAAIALAQYPYCGINRKLIRIVMHAPITEM